MALDVVIAPDSFKGSLPAGAAAAAIAEGWAERRPDDRLRVLPQADGGEGTLDAVATATVGARQHTIAPVTGPDGRPTTASWLELPNRVAVAELAESSGLPLMAHPDAMRATTRGLGEVLRHAVRSGARSLVVALGGSASTDGGAGALQALGLRLLRADGSDIPPGGGGLSSLHRVDSSGLLLPPEGGVTLLTDVTAPLLGSTGAAAVYGPQKGATTDEVRRLDAALSCLASLLGGDPTAPGAGAAGGTAYGLAAVWGASMEPGAPWVARATGLHQAIEDADAVITGEGRFDATSLTGKVVGTIIRRAGGDRVGVVAGSLDVEPACSWSISLSDLAGSADGAMEEPRQWLRQAGRAAADHFGR